MSSRRNPFEELERLFEQMSRQFNDPSQWWGDEQRNLLSRAGGSMAVDVVDRGEEFVVTVDVPGFESDEVDVRVTDQTLHIEAEHEEAFEQDGEFIRQERSRRAMKRSVRLPDTVDTGAIEANLEQGVLTVWAPKTEPATEGHHIEIESE